MKKFRETHLFAFLDRFDREKTPLDLALQNYFRSHKSLGSHDRRFLGDTIYALMRNKGLLDFLLRDPCWEKRYALLSRLDTFQLESLPAWAQASVSEWFFQELTRTLSQEKAFSLCQALNEQAPLTIRANLLKITREQLLVLFKNRLKAHPCRYSKTGIQITERASLTALPEFKKGFFEIQDEGSQLVSELVQCTPGDQVLDYCSGSGGKSLAFAPFLEGKGQIYLHDIRIQALQEAKRRLRRAGIENAQCLAPDHPRLNSLKNSMDWVIADVPCSGSGTYRRNPDMKWKISESTLERLLIQQRTIFTKATEFLRPNGKIVYATCSIFSRENEQQVEFFLKSLPLEIVQEPLILYPERSGPDGFFAIVLRKK